MIIAATANAVNLTDGLDGLAAGSATFCFACLAVIGYWQFRHFAIYHVAAALDLALAAVALAGACLGFLWWNAAPARIFMGDTGSLSIGSGLAALCLLMNLDLLLPVIGGLFVIVTLSVVIQVVSFRVFHRRVFRMAPLHHHFELLGWPETTVIVRFWILAGLFAALGLGIFYGDFLSVGKVLMPACGPPLRRATVDEASRAGRPSTAQRHADGPVDRRSAVGRLVRGWSGPTRRGERRPTSRRRRSTRASRPGPGPRDRPGRLAGRRRRPAVQAPTAQVDRLARRLVGGALRVRPGHGRLGLAGHLPRVSTGRPGPSSSARCCGWGSGPAPCSSCRPRRLPEVADHPAARWSWSPWACWSWCSCPTSG